MTLVLWELHGRDDCRFSTFSWRTRLALHHKGLDFDVRPVRMSDKAAIAFSGQGKVPILVHDTVIVTDSWRIARYLEEQFPDRPSLFGGGIGESMTHFFNLWTDREVVPGLVPYLARDVMDCVDEQDAAHLRQQLEGIFKKPLEDLSRQRDDAIPRLRRTLGGVRKLLDRQPFIAGSAPAYADYILFGAFQWSRVVSVHPVLEPDDVIAVWFERMLDLFGGVGRQQPARGERMREQAS